MRSSSMTFINIAIAKGRLIEDSISMLHKMGIHFPDYDEESRKLIFCSENHSYRMILVKPSDVPTYVERGAADIGIVGKDSLLESMTDVFEIADLKYGACKMVIAGLDEKTLFKKKLVVASKYPNIARQFFQSQGRVIDTVKLNGSVELAPLIGLSDCIVDIVESGKTLKENGLKVIEEIFPISARLIVNKASLKTKPQFIQPFLQSVQSIVNSVGRVEK